MPDQSPAPARVQFAHQTAGANLEQVRCELCNGDNHVLCFEGSERRHGLPGRFRMVECQSCGHVYLNPRPDAASIAAYYPESYAPYAPPRGAMGALTRMLRQSEARALARRLPRGARVLEVGCAAGDLLGPLKAAGFEVVGIEPSEQAAAHARERLGLDVYTGTLGSVALPAGSVDAIVMRHVIEHVPSPRRDVELCAKLLRPRGRLILATDNAASLDCRLFGADWYGFDVPRHLNLFTPTSLAQMVEAAGLKVTAVRFSLVPNHWIVSARYALERRIGASAVTRLLSLRNPVLAVSLLPVTLAQRWMQNGGRMILEAEKE